MSKIYIYKPAKIDKIKLFFIIGRKLLGFSVTILIGKTVIKVNPGHPF